MMAPTRAASSGSAFRAPLLHQQWPVGAPLTAAAPRWRGCAAICGACMRRQSLRPEQRAADAALAARQGAISSAAREGASAELAAAFLYIPLPRAVVCALCVRARCAFPATSPKPGAWSAVAPELAPLP